MIELINLTKEYAGKDGAICALRDVNLTINDGAIFGIIGLSGAGKSTLVRCINLLERPTAGQVLLDGEDLTKVSKKRLLELRRSIGMIFQNFNLLQQRTVEENVRFPLEIARMRKNDVQRVNELLALVGLEEKKKSYPAELSGGQKQRVAIARALATSPKYLLCDEATSALDPATTESILQLLKKINAELGVTIIVITHEMRVVESICTEVAVIDNSMIAEYGKVSDVFSFPQSEIAKQLIIPELVRSVANSGEGYKLRLVFNGQISNMPVVSALAIELGVAVNILYADTKSIDGKTFGHMVITIPAREKVQNVKEYLDKRGITYKEEI